MAPPEELIPLYFERFSTSGWIGPKSEVHVGAGIGRNERGVEAIASIQRAEAAHDRRAVWRFG
jgi:hypothetical protein